jgi:hypothetical protein
VRGQEVDPVAWRIARARLAVHDVEADLGRAANTIVDDQWPTLRADRVVLDPPVGKGEEQAEWLGIALGHVADDGRAVAVMPASEVVHVGSARRKPNERTWSRLAALVDAGQVTGVVVLPRRMRSDVVGPLTVWVIDRDRTDVSVQVLGFGWDADASTLDPLRRGAPAIGGCATVAAVRDALALVVSRLEETASRSGRSIPRPDAAALEREVRRLRRQVSAQRHVEAAARELRQIAGDVRRTDADLHRRLMDIVRQLE